ncbi:hypothetical protein ACFV23_02430, partial [Streptomyces sp. NPDC059627]
PGLPGGVAAVRGTAVPRPPGERARGGGPPRGPAPTGGGDRRLTARAIARAALAGQGGGVERPAFVSGAASGPVPQRVQALLTAPRVGRRAGAWVAVLLLVACAGLSCVASASGMIDFHHRVEVAQGEAER